MSINPAAVGQLHRAHAQAATEGHRAAPVPRPTPLGEVRATRNHGNQSTRLRPPYEGVVASLTMKNDSPLFPVVSERWGFGMSPPKPAVHKSRRAASECTLRVLEHKSTAPNTDPLVMESLSVVKGLFNRIVREDQWDWFTVAGQLGYPSRRISRVIAQELSHLRTAIKLGHKTTYETTKTNLRRLPTRRCLSVFLGTAKIADEPGAGWIYILSTREMRNLLKVGMTTRSVEERVKEINAATGVAIPFGVRRCWRVSDPSLAESLVHAALREHRLRQDREFFQVSFKYAGKVVDAVIRESSQEIRTLDALAGLA